MAYARVCEYFRHKFYDFFCKLKFCLLLGAHGPGAGYGYEMVEKENDEMVDHLSSKVQALKSVSLLSQIQFNSYQFKLLITS